MSDKTRFEFLGIKIEAEGSQAVVIMAGLGLCCLITIIILNIIHS